MFREDRYSILKKRGKEENNNNTIGTGKISAELVNCETINRFLKIYLRRVHKLQYTKNEIRKIQI